MVASLHLKFMVHACTLDVQPDCHVGYHLQSKELQDGDISTMMLQYLLNEALDKQQSTGDGCMLTSYEPRMTQLDMGGAGFHLRTEACHCFRNSPLDLFALCVL